MHFDLRKYDPSEEIERVERALGLRFDRQTEVRKRRSIGFRTDRDTWVRIEQQPIARYVGRGNNGLESAAVLDGVARPAWHQSVSWIDQAGMRMWRADETDYVRASVIKQGGTLAVDPDLPEPWWAAFNRSMDALARHVTTRTATPTLMPITQERFTATIAKVFPDVDTRIEEWSAAHGDLAWANITAPEFNILDWEDWGMAPRGFDAAYLRNASLAVPTLADRVYNERRADLDSRTGKLCQLYTCAGVIAAGEDWAGPLHEPAKRLGQDVLSQLGY